jgi:branched-chain amino acid transport system substrate-binding protein
LFWEELGEAAEGCIGPSQWEPHAQGQPVVGPTSAEFIARFQRRFGAPPDYPSAQAYAAGLVLEHCVAQAGTWTDAALRDQACELDCQTFYGRFRLDSETGAQTGHETVLVQWQRGAKRLIWPRAMADAAPVCPKPWVTPLEPGPGAN